MKIERRTLVDDIHPLSLIIMDVSLLSKFLCKIDKQNELPSTIIKILKCNTRKTDIKACIHKSIFALFLPNTLEAGAYTLADRLCEKIKKDLGKNNFNLKKSNHILFQISTYFNNHQVKSEPKIVNKQYKKAII